MKKKTPAIVHILRFVSFFPTLGFILVALFYNKPAPTTSWEWLQRVLIALGSALLGAIFAYGLRGAKDLPSAFDYDSSSHKIVKKADINNFYLLFICSFAWQMFILGILSTLKF